MAVFTRVVDLVDAIEAFQLNQYAATLEGDIGAGRAISLTALNDPTAYSLRVANIDTTNGRAFKVFKANLTDAWIDVTKTGTKIDGLQLVHQPSTPDAPGTGFTTLYPKTDDLLYYRSESGSEIALVDVSSAQTLTNKTLTSPTLTTPTLTTPSVTSPLTLSQIATPSAPASGTSVYSKAGGGLYTRAASGAEIQYVDMSSTQTVGGAKTFSSPVLLPNGTASAPGLAFSVMTNAGLYRVGTDEWGMSIAGDAPGDGGGTTFRFRKGDRWPQIAFGQTDSSGGWIWTDTFYDAPLKLHLVQDLAAGGSVIGAHFEVRNDANSGQGAGVIPDSSAITAVAYKYLSTSNGAMRAGEFQTIVTGDVSDAHAFATSFAIEAGIHMGIDGNGSYKTGILNCISTVDGIPNGPITGAATPHRADVGLLLRGAAGYHWPIRFWDERTTGHFLFNVDGQGRVLGSYNANQAAPSYSFLKSDGTEDPTGMFWGGAGNLGFTAAGTEGMRLNSSGLGIGTTASGSRLAVVGNTSILSGGATTNVIVQIGRTATDAQIAVVGSAGQLANTSTQGDVVIRAESGNDLLFCNGADGASPLRIGAAKLGFFETAPVVKPTVTGSRGGNAALASALTALAGLGLLTDSSSA
jgi:hypothetical protein